VAAALHRTALVGANAAVGFEQRQGVLQQRVRTPVSDAIAEFRHVRAIVTAGIMGSRGQGSVETLSHVWLGLGWD
jgi:hypothetical protein